MVDLEGSRRSSLDFARSFHDYSLNYLLLILTQKPDATMVAGFRQWQAKGRQVREGETSIRIFGYNSNKATERNDEQRIVHYFPVLSVFDISQTDLNEGATSAENPVHQLTGDDDRGVLVTLTGHLKDNGWAVVRENLAQVNGYTDPVTGIVPTTPREDGSGGRIRGVHRRRALWH